MYYATEKTFRDRRGQEKGYIKIGILTDHPPGVSAEKESRMLDYKQTKSTDVFSCKSSFFFCKRLKCTDRARDHSGHYPVQYLDNTGRQWQRLCQLLELKNSFVHKQF